MDGAIHFPPFRLETRAERLWRDDVLVPLRPKTYAVLRHLAARAGRLVTRDELLDAAWPDAHVGHAVLKVCIRELRQALGDDPRSPRFIETHHRRGYRFIAAVALEGGAPRGPDLELFVGRESEQGTLVAWLDRALAARRQIGLVVGEAGIGKTALVEAFLSAVRDRLGPDAGIARGQCAEHSGPGEAFLPVLEALGRLCEEMPAAVPVLRRHAPSWLLQLPGVVPARDREALRRECAGAGRDRMLRELAVGLEAVTERAPLILVLEDLHWSDFDTLDLLLALARRTQPARLLLLGTLRAGEPVIPNSPLPLLRREIASRRLAAEIALGPLSPGAVRAYLEARLGSPSLADRLVDSVVASTEGNALFLTCVADRLAEAAGSDVERVAQEVPATLEAMIECQLGALEPDDRTALEGASLIGVEFSAPALAAALDADLDATEARLCTLARRQQLVRAIGETRWPDGTAAASFEFRHVLHRSALERAIPPARRRTLHRRVAERLERGWGARVESVAAALALHFDRAGEVERAIHYLHVAGDQATERHAYAIALEHLTRALELVAEMPDGPERARQELLLRVSLGTPQLNRHGFGAPEVQATYARALEICRRLGETPQLFPVLAGLQAFYAVAGDLAKAHQLSRQMLALGDRLDDRSMQLDGHHAMGCDLFHMGELGRARVHLERSLSFYDPERADEAYRWTGHDPKTCCLAHLAMTLCYAGALEQAQRRAHEMLEWSEEIRLPFSLAQARTTLGWLHLERGEAEIALGHLDRALALAIDHDLPYCILMASLLRGRALAEHGDGAGGRRTLEEGGALARIMGPHVAEAEYLAISARLAVLAGDPAAEETVERALATARERGEGFLLPDLERLRGEALAARAARGDCRGGASLEREAEAAFRASIEAARRQGAGGRELRASVELGKLWRRQGRAGDVRALLAPLVENFPEARDTADFHAATALLSFP